MAAQAAARNDNAVTAVEINTIIIMLRCIDESQDGFFSVSLVEAAVVLDEVFASVECPAAFGVFFLETYGDLIAFDGRFLDAFK